MLSKHIKDSCKYFYIFFVYYSGELKETKTKDVNMYFFILYLQTKQVKTIHLTTFLGGKLAAQHINLKKMQRLMA